MISHELDIRGMGLTHATQEEWAGMLMAFGTGLANGTMRSVIGQDIPLEAAARAHHEILDGKANGKIVLVP